MAPGRERSIDVLRSANAAHLRCLAETAEAVMSAETWREERDRLVLLLEGIESGRITHIDEDDLRELQATSPKNIALLKERLAQLNVRLG